LYILIKKSNKKQS